MLFLEGGRSYVMKAAHLINAVCAYGRRSTLLERFGVEVLWTLRFVYVFSILKKGQGNKWSEDF